MNAANRVETAFVPYERGVDALRGLAILAVVVYHAFPDRLTGGFVGVDVFFVISGYLITRVLCAEKTLTGGVAIGDFYRRRARRLLPPLIPLLVACLVTGWWWLPAWNYAELGKQVALGGLFVANVGYWLEAGYFDAGSQAKVVVALVVAGRGGAVLFAVSLAVRDMCVIADRLQMDVGGGGCFCWLVAVVER
jgi:peptidoglycan/LPS O-acetylase OafA/YrhL